MNREKLRSLAAPIREQSILVTLLAHSSSDRRTSSPLLYRRFQSQHQFKQSMRGNPNILQHLRKNTILEAFGSRTWPRNTLEHNMIGARVDPVRRLPTVQCCPFERLAKVYIAHPVACCRSAMFVWPALNIVGFGGEAQASQSASSIVRSPDAVS